MIRLKAPDGCRSYSVDGKVYEVPDDGIVEVSGDVALILESHDFKPPVVADVRADAVLTRDEIGHMLGHLGIAVVDSMIPTVKMVDMLKAAVAAKAEDAAKGNEEIKSGIADVVKSIDERPGKKKP